MEDLQSYKDMKIDPREILLYLNTLGIKNISGKMLKEFITDLKRLIKFDLRHKDPAYQNENKASVDESVFDRLYSTTTISFRNRQHKGINENQIDLKPKIGYTYAKTTSVHPFLQKRSKSCDLLDQNKKKIYKQKISVSTCNLIKVPISRPQRRSDPVALYHYYLMMWDKYKDNMPGENDWSELRWAIRKKLVGDTSPRDFKVTKQTEDELQRKRDGWNN